MKSKIATYESDNGPGTLFMEGSQYLFVCRSGPKRFNTKDALNAWLRSEGFTVKGNGHVQR